MHSWDFLTGVFKLISWLSDRTLIFFELFNRLLKNYSKKNYVFIILSKHCCTLYCTKIKPFFITSSYGISVEFLMVFEAPHRETVHCDTKKVFSRFRLSFHQRNRFTMIAVRFSLIAFLNFPYPIFFLLLS